MNRRRTGMWTAAAAVLVLGSCATRIPYEKPVEAVSLFPDGAALYLRLENPLLTEAARALLPPKVLRAAGSFLDRTEQATAAFYFDVSRDAAPDAGELRAEGGSGILGIAEGDYPSRAAAFRLRLSRDWRKEGKGLVSRDGKIHLAFPDRGLWIAGTEDLSPLELRLSSPGPHPVPVELRPLWEAEGALWLARPESLLVYLLGSEAPTLPARAALLSLGPGEKTGSYRGTWVFDFSDERSARVYSPLCRLIHLAFLRAVYGSDEGGADAALGATRWETRGSRVWASGFTVRGRDLFTSFARTPW